MEQGLGAVARDAENSRVATLREVALDRRCVAVSSRLGQTQPVKPFVWKLPEQCLPGAAHVSGGSGAIAVQRIQASLCRNEVEQALPVCVLEDEGDLLEAIVDLPPSSFPPNGCATVANDAVGVDLIPGQNQRLARKLRQLARGNKWKGFKGRGHGAALPREFLHVGSDLHEAIARLQLIEPLPHSTHMLRHADFQRGTGLIRSVRDFMSLLPGCYFNQ